MGDELQVQRVDQLELRYTAAQIVLCDEAWPRPQKVLQVGALPHQDLVGWWASRLMASYQIFG